MLLVHTCVSPAAAKHICLTLRKFMLRSGVSLQKLRYWKAMSMRLYNHCQA